MRVAWDVDLPSKAIKGNGYLPAIRATRRGHERHATGGYVPAEMVRTPWGNASELRDKKLRAGGATPREEALRNQRERLFGATIAVVSEKGYEATTVADLLEISGISRSDFYEHFANKRECLLATVEALIDPTIAMIARAKAPAGEQRAMKAFETLMHLIVKQAPASRVCFVELHAAGAEAERVVDRAFDAFERVVLETNEQMPERREMPPEIIRAAIGGLRKIIHTRLYRREEKKLLGLVPELWQWSLSYYPPPEPLRKLKLSNPATGHFGGYTTAERIARSAAAVTTENGFQAMSTNDIAAHASISLSTFYAHFADKRDAVLAALEMAGAQMMASVVPAARRAPDWREGVRAVYETMCGFLVAEPALARLATVDVYAAGPDALAQRDRVIDSLGAMLAPGYEENPQAPKIAAEAIGGAVYALLRDKVRTDGPEALPEIAPLATYITLTPFIGPEQACAVANGDGRRR